MSTPNVKSTVKPVASAEDVAYFDRILAKRGDLRPSIMPEYFSMPSWWTPTAKPKAGESFAERQIRDWNSWRKSYARTFRDKGLKRIDGILFYAAKITAGVYVVLCREGKRAYCLEYARQFGTDESSFLGMVGLESCYPAVMEAIRMANAYHRVNRDQKASEADRDTALATYRAAFDRAHEALRLIDTTAPDAPAKPAKPAKRSKAIKVAESDRAPASVAPVVPAEESASVAPIV